MEPVPSPICHPLSLLLIYVGLRDGAGKKRLFQTEQNFEVEEPHLRKGKSANKHCTYVRISACNIALSLKGTTILIWLVEKRENL